MSLAIDPEGVIAVLLAHGAGWRDVRTGTFEIDAYEWVLGPITVGASSYGGILPAVGFRFVDNGTGEVIAGPLTSVVAVAGKSR